MEYTPLCHIAHKYGTDKCPQIHHSYTPFYYELLKDKQKSIKKILELGIGYPRTMMHVPGYKTGSSLYMWREFMPNAFIFGLDNRKDAIFQDHRITTYLFDTQKDDIKTIFNKIGNDIDLVIDDSSHFSRNQINVFNMIMPRLPKHSIYIIEDVRHPQYLKKKLENGHYKISISSLSEKYNTEPNTDNLVIIKK